MPRVATLGRTRRRLFTQHSNAASASKAFMDTGSAIAAGDTQVPWHNRVMARQLPRQVHHTSH